MASITIHNLEHADTISGLIGIARAARAAGDRHLERAIRRELLETYQIDVRFRDHPARQPQETAR